MKLTSILAAAVVTLGTPAATLHTPTTHNNTGTEHTIKLTIKPSELPKPRDYFKELIENTYPALTPFGTYLDNIDSTVISLATQDERFRTYEVPLELGIPDYFFADSLNVRMIASKSNKSLSVYANQEGTDELIFNTRIAIGGWHQVNGEGEEVFFGTPSGTYYIKRIVQDPTWYPPKEWNSSTGRVPPGPDNPLGAWMAELCKDNCPSAYESDPCKTPSRIRLHARTLPKKYLSLVWTHGCVAIGKEEAEELFPALLRYLPHQEPKTTDRGTIYPLNRQIEFVIED
ncbi:MAG: L,D-transpeptidase [Candidatus Woesearchaeota archaeon]